jgi:hypothetical protein
MGYAKQNEINFTKITEAERKALPIRKGEQDILDALYKVFEAGYKINNAEYMKRNGKTLKKKEGDYVHVVVHPATMSKDVIDKRESKVFKEISSTMSRTRAVKGMMMQDILVYANDFIEDTAKYGAYVNELQTFSDITGDVEVRNAIKQKFGQNANGKSPILVGIDNAIKEVQKKSDNRTDMSGQQLQKVQSNIIKSILSGRATTPLIQPASYFMGVTKFTPKAQAQALTKIPNFKEMIANVPRVYARTFKGFDKDAMKASHTAKGKITKFTDNLINAGLHPIKVMDMMTIGYMWEASKIDAKGDLTKAGELMAEALDSQPNFTPLERADVMRSRNPVVKIFTMFGSAKNAAYNEVVQGAMKLKQTGDPALLGKALTGYTLSHLFMTGVRTGISALKGDETEFWEKFLMSFLSGIPGLDTMLTSVQGFDLNSPIMDKYNELTAAVARAVKMSKNPDKYTANEIVDTGYKLTDALFSLRGLGLNNYRESLEFAINTATGATSQASTTAKRILDPYKKTYSKEFYTDLLIAFKKDKPIEPLLKEMKKIGITRESLKNRLDKEIDEDKLTFQQKLKILQQVKK